MCARERERGERGREGERGGERGREREGERERGEREILLNNSDYISSYLNVHGMAIKSEDDTMVTGSKM